jgi:serine protease Do
MTEDVKNKYNVANGIYVSEVQTGSPAFNADLKSGDIILFVNNKTILSSNNFYTIISEYTPGTEIDVKIKRTSGNSEEVKTLTIILGEKPQQ